MLLILRVAVLVYSLISLTFAESVQCYVDGGRNLPRLYMLPKTSDRTYSACTIESRLDPISMKINHIAMSGGDQSDVGFRIYYDGGSARIIARYGCYNEMCNTVDALLVQFTLQLLQLHREIIQAILRKESARVEKRSILSKKMVYSIEHALSAAHGRNKERKLDTPFIICAISTAIFALFASLHLIGVMLTSSRCIGRCRKM
ncbi:hypothetical protein Y032_0003g1505 [Ancylostoma ceylanicum]|uniref:GOLD domain-containing protein n=1 Tax=Ancylostoma ceylanicum TaxID=53326 RepID=A0A016VZU1_9BILA|nr:hypothetical protein Y032_0003g1505 [Ancylostoma ceylanicum]